ncbi:MAG: S8 family peptidase, partial [Dehalococcoidia bacterium]|nr:S8 family peptidase [Dehalococcoidia bacterium]
MNRKIYFLSVILLSLLVGLIGPISASAQPPDTVKVLIAFNSQPGPGDEAIVRQAGGSLKYNYHLVPAIAASVPAVAINGLSRNPRITRIEPDLEVQAIAQTLPWGVNRIDAEFAHAGGVVGTGIKVAVLDSGIDLDHPDLNVAGSVNFAGGGKDADDKYGHGTHVAGIIGAKDNGTGVIGVAPGVSLYAVKVLGNSGSGNYSDVIAGLQWAVVNGMQVTNNSYGSAGNPGATVEAAFDQAYSAGIINIAAAGNEYGSPVIYPARYGSVVAVSATTTSDSLAGFSNIGPEVELAAPGVSILSTYKSGGYTELSGTSMASPHVAGVAALIISSGTVTSNDGQYGIANEVRNRLTSTATDLGATGRDTWYGYGLVDAEKAALGTQNGNDLPSASNITDIAVASVTTPASVTKGNTASVTV